MKKCFGYVRVSTVKQGDGVSPEAQRDAILDFASRNGIEIVQWFEEKKTAAKRGRPLFGRMVSELRKGKAAGVVIHKIDRSARNFADWAKIGDLADAGVDIHFATESLDFRSRGGRLTADIQAVIAADYIRNLREETLKGINGRLKQGLFPFRAPIGYVDNGRGQPKTPDPVMAPLVKLAFELYASGRHSLRSVHAEMRRRGLTSYTGRPITMHGIETILNNPFYTGVIRIKRTGMTYHGVHDRLISPNLFQRVQDVKAGKTSPKITRHNHIYQGLFRCGHCGGPMIAGSAKGHVYYFCRPRSCPTKTVREERVAEAIDACLANAELTDADVEAFIARIDAWLANGGTAKEERAWQLRKAELQDRIDRLTDALIDRLIDRDAFADRRQRLALEEEVMADEWQGIRNRATKAEELRYLVKLANNLVTGHNFAKQTEKRQWVEMTTLNRRVYGRNITIEPSSWLVSLKQSAAVTMSDPHRYRDKTLAESPDWGHVVDSAAIDMLNRLKSGDHGDRLVA